MTNYRQAFKDRQRVARGDAHREEVRQHAQRFLNRFYEGASAAYTAARKRADSAPEHSFERTRYNAIAELIWKGEVQ